MALRLRDGTVLRAGGSFLCCRLQPHTLRAVPGQDTGEVALTWQAASDAEAIVERWQPGQAAEVIASAVTGGSYTDTAVTPNTVYRYRVKIGTRYSNTAVGIVSDITLPFNMPALERVDPALLGVDRTETFTGPNGDLVTVTVLAPLAKPTVVTVTAGTAAENYTNLAAAMTTVKAAGGGTVRLPAGDFYVNPGDDLHNIVIGTANDIILAGAGLDANNVPLTRVFFSRGNSPELGISSARGISIASSNRVLVKDIIFDWDFPNAIPGVVTTVGGVQRLTVQNPEYYVPDPENPPAIYAVVGYHLDAKCYDLRSGSRSPTGGTFNANFAVDGLYFYTLGANYFPEGTEAVGIVRGSTGWNIGSAASNVSFENCWLVGGGGPGIINGAQGGGLRLSNCRLTRKPDFLLAEGELPRFISFFGDNDANSTSGDILIENSEIAYVDDDWFYARAPMRQLQTLDGTTGFVIARSSQSVAHTFTTGKEAIQFVDPHTLGVVSEVEPQATWTQVFSAPNWVWTVSFASVPELAPYIGLPEEDLPFAVMPDWGCPNIIIRKSQFHEGFSRILIRTRNVLIEDNIFANCGYAAVELDLLPTDGTSAAGPAPSNVKVSRNIFAGTGWSLTDLNWFGITGGYYQTGHTAGHAIQLASIASDGFTATGYPMRWIDIDENWTFNTPGIAILSNAVQDANIRRNTIVNANQVPFTPGFNATYCGVNSEGEQAGGANQPWCISKVAGQGSVMLTHSRRVDATGNTILGTSEAVFADSATTSSIVS